MVSGYLYPYIPERRLYDRRVLPLLQSSLILIYQSIEQLDRIPTVVVMLCVFCSNVDLCAVKIRTFGFSFKPPLNARSVRLSFFCMEMARAEMINGDVVRLFGADDR